MNNDARLEAKVEKMAQWLWQARARRLPYRNLPDELRPASIAEAYAAQEAYHRLAEPSLGAVAGAKIATTTTTKVMQQLMGIARAPRLSGSPIMSPRAAAISKLAWSSSPAVSSPRFRSPPAGGRFSRSMAWAKP
jgi:hypothetical protein